MHATTPAATTLQLRTARWLFVALLAVALLRIAATYSVFNNTVDELNHIAAGMEWLDHGTYKYETMHPPMRAVYAIGPRLLGRHYSGDPDITAEGREIVYGDGRYWRNLTAARLAALPFFALTMFLTFAWASRLGGPLAGVFAALAYSTLPLALGHAGVAATDTLGTAMLLLALYAWTLWLDERTSRRALLFGLAAGLALVAKMSNILFLLAIVGVTAAMTLLRVRMVCGAADSPPLFSARLRQLAVAASIGALALVLVLWVTYRFALTPILDPADRPHEQLDRLVGASGLLHSLAYWLVELPIPAVDFLRGVLALEQRNGTAQPSVFLGALNTQGDPRYFPLAILVKTPIPFLVLAVAGVIALFREAWRRSSPLLLLPPLAALLIVLVCLPSHLNIGLRHILSIFPLLAIAIGVVASRLWQAGPRSRVRTMPVARATVVLLLAWQAYGGLRAHPDYLSFFNECCRTEPQRWLLESDVDWGQDLERLAAELRRRGVNQLHIAYFGTADIDQHGLPPHSQLPPYQRVSGWIAISEFRAALGTWEPPYDQYRWLQDYQPVARVGASIRLYQIPESP
jgi:hypothetical protein